MEIEIKNLTYKVEDKYIFEDLNLSLKNGTYLLSGINGSGKTTLLNILHGTLKKYEGRVKVPDKAVYINQGLLLFENLTIVENLKILVDKDKRVFVINILEDVLDIGMNQKVRMLSGGEKQFLNLLIGFSKGYRIYFIDEPFNNLSQDKIKIIKEMIEDLKEKVDILIIVDHYEKISVDTILEIENRSINVIS